MSFKPHFRRFLEVDPGRIHFAAHSHHFWPDVSFEAHQQAWLDAARHADNKWDVVFGEQVPRAQAHIARRLGLPGGESIAFAPNTHELFMRIVSCLPHDRPLRVLTTDSEFHSFARQAARLEEAGIFRITPVPTEPFATFGDRFLEEARRPGWDLVYLSQVFFNSGWAVPQLASLVADVTPEALVVIDGYHAFGAIPVDLSPIAHRAFYLAGGYKYAMSGEGVCFVHAPPGVAMRPVDTGWFAAFGALAESVGTGVVPYGPDGMRFFGATFDPSAVYRFNAVMDWLDREDLTPTRLHRHVVELQEVFVRELAKETVPLREHQLVVPLDEPSRGQFLTFRTPAAGDIHARLLDANMVTDVRGDRLRFGFAIYHDEGDIGRGVARLVTALA